VLWVSTPLGYDRDAQGNLVANPASVTTAFAYDGLNRRVLVTEAVGLAAAADHRDGLRRRGQRGVGAVRWATTAMRRNLVAERRGC
jgi:YD repeat-containing protein